VQAADPFANVVVAGDLNDYQFSPVLHTLTTGATGLVSLISGLPANEQYTYIFNGISQVLDHILVSRSLSDVEYEVVHLNAEFAEQASDHDPQVARVRPAPVCARTVSGLHVGPLTASSGALCLQGATQIGPVFIGPGAKLVIDGSTVIGGVRANGAAVVQVCGTGIVGGVELTATTGPVRLGGAGCAANVIVGRVNVADSTGGAVISGNRIVGGLSCRANVPPPTNEGAPNQVVGARTGQCATL
jgi:hypothetical protein